MYPPVTCWAMMSPTAMTVSLSATGSGLTVRSGAREKYVAVIVPRPETASVYVTTPSPVGAALNMVQPERPRSHDVGSMNQFETASVPIDAPDGRQVPTAAPEAAS